MESEGNYWTRRSAWLTRRRFIAGSAAAGVGAAALAAWGCGDDSTSSTPASGATKAAATAAGSATAGGSTAVAAAAGDPKYGGTLKMGWGGATSEQPNQDPQQTPTALLHLFGSGVAYSRLIRSKVGPDVPLGQNIIASDLAASWEQPDNKTYVFKLDPAAKWQNIAPMNGRAVTAQDIIYSYQRQLQLKTNASGLAVVDTMTAIDDKTIRLTSAAPNVEFLISLVNTVNKIVGKEVVDQFGDLKTAPVVGSGAWIQEDWKAGSIITFKKNPDYWKKDAKGRALPYTDRLEILRIPDAATLISAFRTKKFLVYGILLGSVNEYNQLKKENPELQSVPIAIKYTPGTSLGVRTDQPPTKDIRVRQAISKAIDRKSVIEGAQFGSGWLTANIQLPGPDWSLPDAELEKLLAYDPKGAQAMLKEAGFAGWKPEMKFLFLDAQKSSAELIQPNLQSVGIDPKLLSCDNVCHAEGQTQGNFEMFVTSGLRGTNTTADLTSFFKTGASRNGVKLSDPDVDRLIDSQAQEFDEKKRRDILLDLQRRVINAAGYIPIVGGGLPAHLVWPEVKNWSWFPTSEYAIYENVWLA